MFLIDATDLPRGVSCLLVFISKREPSTAQGRGIFRLLSQSRKALQEGACDTIGELISSRNINEHLKIYGRTHDAEIWRDFEADMYKPDFSKWVYSVA